MSNWEHCGCTQLETASGNGCLKCNPEFAYEIAQQLWREAKERKEAEEK